MQNPSVAVAAVNLPHESRIGGFYPVANFADAYAIVLPEHASRDPEVLARHLFARQPSVVKVLLKVRDLLVAPLGLKPAHALQAMGTARPDQHVGIFRIFDANADEIILGEDDKHLDFRLSVLCRPIDATDAHRSELVLSTVVKCHNRIGRVYIALVAPFHRRIVRESLRRGARFGWPSRGAA